MKMQGGPSGTVCSALLILALALPCLGPGRARAENMARTWSDGQDFGWAGNVNFYFGQRGLDDGEWSPVERQMNLGVDLDFTNSSFPVGLGLGLQYSKAEEDDAVAGTNVTVETKITEFVIGPRKVWYGLPLIRPFLGVGVSLLHVDAERKFAGATSSDNSTGLGAWAEVGTYVKIYGPVHLGGSFRYSTVPVRLFDEDRDAGGWIAGGMLGFHWED